MKFLNITKNVEVKIVCKIIGAGITFDNVHDPYEGKVEFKLKIEDWAARDTSEKLMWRMTYLLSHRLIFISYDCHMNVLKLQWVDSFYWEVTHTTKNQYITQRTKEMGIIPNVHSLVFCGYTVLKPLCKSLYKTCLLTQAGVLSKKRKYGIKCCFSSFFKL